MVLVVKAAAQGVVDIVSLSNQVGDGELDLMHPEPLNRVFGSQCVAIAEIEQDGGGLADDNVSIF